MKSLLQQLTEELTAQTNRVTALQYIVDELFTIAAPGAIKKALWTRYQGIVEGASPQPGGVEVTVQACRFAFEQAARDLPYAHAGEARLFQYHEHSQRWYIEVEVTHHDPDQGNATVLYRVWRTPDGFRAMKVTIEEDLESEGSR